MNQVRLILWMLRKHTLPGPSVKLFWTVLVMMMVSRVIQAVILVPSKLLKWFTTLIMMI